MCIFGSPPPPPPLPEPRPTPPMPEETADAPITGRKRTVQQTPTKTATKKKTEGTEICTRTTGAAALGTSSLRIPLLPSAGRDLNY